MSAFWTLIKGVASPYLGSVKLVGVGLLIAVLLGSIAYCKYDEHRTETLQTTVATDKTVISGQQAQIKNQAKTQEITTTTSKVTENTIVKRDADLASDAQQYQSIQSNTTTQVQQITTRPKPPAQSTADFQASQANDVANAQLDGLWQTYCVSTNQPLTCGDQT